MYYKQVVAMIPEVYDSAFNCSSQSKLCDTFRTSQQLQIDELQPQVQADASAEFSHTFEIYMLTRFFFLLCLCGHY